MEGIETLSLQLDENETMALAQFVKRLSWSDLRGCAVNDEEAWVMKSAVDKLQQALREEGYAPR
ncbi:TPA: hypothetical protein I8385_003328 [Citrobacter freundii]|uniref:DUF7706 family protein n=1 Tax=Enterobacterales TaxID=91347 RepID=UPI00019B198F|nr:MULTISPECIES: hypothetical protein [Enterobacterales]EAA7946230.1 hypothetical protein [Salmonella enterica]EBF6276396.1 hypothetical protein [Salmonella enterica subsp. enterica serovar Cubana]ECV2562549.1 hypothetical protein [Salmonella enterica subsp. enterica serovar Saintpaul]MDV1191912.1 hypothetical protein [Raoultella planticola]HAT2787902.1 hypothetical protein [Citrobacter freundii]HDW2924801.1 hypothetical protein [Escherichia coli]